MKRAQRSGTGCLDTRAMLQKSLEASWERVRLKGNIGDDAALDLAPVPRTRLCDGCDGVRHHEGFPGAGLTGKNRNTAAIHDVLDHALGCGFGPQS